MPSKEKERNEMDQKFCFRKGRNGSNLKNEDSQIEKIYLKECRRYS